MSQQDERTVVRTYVPEYQRDAWAEAADSMGMSLSEFVRSMVQAGRRGFDLEDSTAGRHSSPVEPRPGHVNPRGRPLEDRVLEALDPEAVRSWDELVAELSGDFEDQLQAALDSLMESGDVGLDHRAGGYRIRGDD